MKRWYRNSYVECVLCDAFIADIIQVYGKHGLAISHEDGHGAFEIVVNDEFHQDWLRHAHKEFDNE